MQDQSPETPNTQALPPERALWLLVDGLAGHAIVMLDAQGRVTHWSRGAENLSQHAPAQVVGQPFATLFAPEQLAGGDLERALRTARRDGKGVLDATWVRRDGSRLPAHTLIHPVFDPPGVCIGYATVTEAATERRAAGPTHEGAMLAALVETAADGILMIDQHGTVRMANAACERLFGYSAAELLGRNVNLLMPAPDSDRHDDYIASYLRTGERKVIGIGRQVTARRSNGATFPIMLSVGEAKQDGQSVFVGIVHDLTEHNRQEAELRAAQKMEAIGRLAAGVAHDFNNILQTVLGNLELLLEGTPLRSDDHELASAAQEAAKRGAALTNHLLAYTRQQVLLPRPEHVSHLVEELRDLLARTLGPHISVETLVEPQVPQLRADRSQLQTALLNLAMNAADAMRRGGRLRLEAYEVKGEGFGEAKPGHYVVLAVTDTGSGMSPEVLAHAFDPFFTTKGINGTGLGLPMVLGFSRQSGGDARILSVLGRGTRVEIWLPAALPSVAATEIATDLRLRGRGRVLLVDDMPDVLVTTSAFLRKAGFEVVQRDSGDRALALLSAGERFDALVTDYAMPGLSGVDVVEQAAMLQPGLPALMITGFAAVDDNRLPVTVRLLRKPFRRDDLVREVLLMIGAGSPEVPRMDVPRSAC
jgi:PAS domain S-box-containing protein